MIKKVDILTCSKTNTSNRSSDHRPQNFITFFLHQLSLLSQYHIVLNSRVKTKKRRGGCRLWIQTVYPMNLKQSPLQTSPQPLSRWKTESTTLLAWWVNRRIINSKNSGNCSSIWWSVNGPLAASELKF